MAHDAVPILRAEAGHNPNDKRLTDLVGELSTRSEDFRRLWASHDVRYTAPEAGHVEDTLMHHT